MIRPILVVEDDGPTRDALRKLLRANGHIVVAAANGREALERLQETEPFVILLDYEMPVMDGRAFREAQKADTRWSKIPVVLMTAHDFPAFDAVAILQKPVTYTMLRPLLEAFQS